MRTGFETLPRTTAFTPVDQNLHCCSLDMRKTHRHRGEYLIWMIVFRRNAGWLCVSGQEGR